MATPKKRITLSVADKLKMLDRIKAGEPRQKLVAEMGISMRTLEKIVANEAEIRDTAATIPDKSRKRKRTGKNEDVESALGSFSAVRNKKQTVTDPMLMEKSKDFAERLGSDLTPSTGWLARWKNRMGIKFKRAHGEKSSADEAAAENWLMHIYVGSAYMSGQTAGQTPVIYPDSTVSVTLVCQFLSVAQFIQTTTRSVPFGIGLKGMHISVVGLD